MKHVSVLILSTAAIIAHGNVVAQGLRAVVGQGDEQFPGELNSAYLDIADVALFGDGDGNGLEFQDEDSDDSLSDETHPQTILLMETLNATDESAGYNRDWQGVRAHVYSDFDDALARNYAGGSYSAAARANSASFEGRVETFAGLGGWAGIAEDEIIVSTAVSGEAVLSSDASPPYYASLGGVFGAATFADPTESPNLEFLSSANVGLAQGGSFFVDASHRRVRDHEGTSLPVSIELAVGVRGAIFAGPYPEIVGAVDASAVAYSVDTAAAGNLYVAGSGFVHDSSRYGTAYGLLIGDPISGYAVSSGAGTVEDAYGLYVMPNDSSAVTGENWAIVAEGNVDIVGDTFTHTTTSSSPEWTDVAGITMTLSPGGSWIWESLIAGYLRINNASGSHQAVSPVTLMPGSVISGIRARTRIFSSSATTITLRLSRRDATVGTTESLVAIGTVTPSSTFTLETVEIPISPEHTVLKNNTYTLVATVQNSSAAIADIQSVGYQTSLRVY